MRTWSRSGNARPGCCKDCTVEYEDASLVRPDWIYRHVDPAGKTTEREWPDDYEIPDFKKWLESLHQEEKKGDRVRERDSGEWRNTAIRIACLSAGCHVEYRRTDWTYCHTSPDGVETYTTFGSSPRVPGDVKVKNWVSGIHAQKAEKPIPLEPSREQAYRSVIKTLTESLQEIEKYDPYGDENQSNGFEDDFGNVVSIARDALDSTSQARYQLEKTQTERRVQPVPSEEPWQAEVYVRGAKVL